MFNQGDGNTQKSTRNFLKYFDFLTWLLIGYVLLSLVYQSCQPLQNINRFRDVKSYTNLNCYTIWVRLPEEIPLVSRPTLENTRPITVWARMNLDEAGCKEIMGTQGEDQNQEKPTCEERDETQSEVLIECEQDEVQEAIKLHLDFVDGQELGFLEEGNLFPDGSIWLIFEQDALESRREQLYVYFPLSSDTPDKLDLAIKVFVPNTISTQGKKSEFLESIHLSVQSHLSASLFRFADIIFGIPAATLFAWVGVLAQLYIKDRNEKERERKQAEQELEQKTVEFQNKIEKLNIRREDLGEYVFELSCEAHENNLGDKSFRSLFYEFENCKKWYAVGNSWNKSLRSKIIEMIKEDSTNYEHFKYNIQQWYEIIGWPDWPSKNAGDELITFFKWYTNEPLLAVLDSAKLNNVLFVFRFLGLESTHIVIKKMIEYIGQPSVLEALEESWLDQGKATGRYLLDLLVDAIYQNSEQATDKEDEKKIASQIIAWQKNDPAPPNKLAEDYRIWPARLRFQTPNNEKFSGGWQQPFGPLNTEDDPRLPLSQYSKGDPSAGASDMFYPALDQPWGQDIFLPVSGFYRFGAGKGKTAFIWMGRHQRRYWGEKPAFSVYLSLTGNANKEIFWRELENAMGDALISNLVEDPYWLLSAPRKAKERIITFLISWAGSFSKLIKWLLDAGFPPDDETMLTDTILVAMSAKSISAELYKRHDFSFLLRDVLAVMARGAENRMVLGETFSVFWWIELKSVPSVHNWIKIIGEEGLPGLGIVKIFSDEFTNRSVLSRIGISKQVEIQWTQDAMCKLLAKRLKGCQWEAMPMLWDDYMHKNDKLISKEQLLEEAGDSPRELIRLGNQILFHLH